MVDGINSPIDIAYAEMELVKVEEKNANWDSELVWESGKNTYYYFPKEDKVYSNKWPSGLTLEPYTHKLSPIDFMVNWEDKFAGELLEGLTTTTNLKTLVLAQAIELPEAEGSEFVADLITSLLQLSPQVSTLSKAIGISFSRTINELISGNKTQTRRAWRDDYAKNFIRYYEENIAIPALDKGRHRGGRELGFIKLTQRPYQQYLSEMSPIDLQEEGGMVATAQEFIDTFFEGQDKLVWVLHFEALSTPVSSNTNDELMIKNQQLLIQLAEAETTIQTMIAASTASPLEPEQTAELPVEDAASTASPLESQTWLEVLDSNHFTEGYIQLGQLNEEPTESYRGWNIYTYDSSVADISHPIKGIFSIDFSWALEKEIIKPLEWLKNIINQVEDFCPGQLSLFPKNQPEFTTTTENLDRDNNVIIAAKRERIEKDLESLTQELLRTKDEKKTKKIRADIRIQESRQKDVDDFVTFKIGDSVIRNIYPDKKGIIDKLDISTTGLLSVWVVWSQQYEEEPNSPEEHNVGTLTKIGDVDGGEK